MSSFLIPNVTPFVPFTERLERARNIEEYDAILFEMREFLGQNPDATIRKRFDVQTTRNLLKQLINPKKIAGEVVVDQLCGNRWSAASEVVQRVYDAHLRGDYALSPSSEPREMLHLMLFAVCNFLDMIREHPLIIASLSDEHLSFIISGFTSIKFAFRINGEVAISPERIKDDMACANCFMAVSIIELLTKPDKNRYGDLISQSLSTGDIKIERTGGGRISSLLADADRRPPSMKVLGMILSGVPVVSKVMNEVLTGTVPGFPEFRIKGLVATQLETMLGKNARVVIKTAIAESTIVYELFYGISHSAPGITVDMLTLVALVIADANAASEQQRTKLRDLISLSLDPTYANAIARIFDSQALDLYRGSLSRAYAKDRPFYNALIKERDAAEKDAALAATKTKSDNAARQLMAEEEAAQKKVAEKKKKELEAAGAIRLAVRVADEARAAKEKEARKLEKKNAADQKRQQEATAAAKRGASEEAAGAGAGAAEDTSRDRDVALALAKQQEYDDVKAAIAASLLPAGGADAKQPPPPPRPRRCAAGS